MKKLVLLALVLLFLVGCGLSEADVATSVAQTIEAMATDTPEPTATSTPRPTSTPLPEAYPILTEDERATMKYSLDEMSGEATLEYLKNYGQAVKLRSWLDITPQGEPANISFFYSYIADDWLFIDSILINADGERYTLDLCYENTDVLDDGQIMESVAACFDLSDKEMIEQIANADNVGVRLNGSSGNHDIRLSEKERFSLKYAFQTFANLSEGTIEMKDGIQDGEEIWWK